MDDIVRFVYLHTWSTSSDVEGNTCLGSFNNGLAILIHCSRNLGSHVTEPPPPELTLLEVFLSPLSFPLEEIVEEEVPLANLRFGCGMNGGPILGLWQCDNFAENIDKI